MFLHMNQATTVNRLHPILHKIYPSSDIKQALAEIEPKQPGLIAYIDQPGYFQS